MPPKVKTTKDAIVSTAVEIVRQQGAEALNARAIAAENAQQLTGVSRQGDALENIGAVLFIAEPAFPQLDAGL